MVREFHIFNNFVTVNKSLQSQDFSSHIDTVSEQSVFLLNANYFLKEKTCNKANKGHSKQKIAFNIKQIVETYIN
jgi:hypothetical protein